MNPRTVNSTAVPWPQGNRRQTQALVGCMHIYYLVLGRLEYVVRFEMTQLRDLPIPPMLRVLSKSGLTRIGVHGSAMYPPTVERTAREN